MFDFVEPSTMQAINNDSPSLKGMINKEDAGGIHRHPAERG